MNYFLINKHDTLAECTCGQPYAGSFQTVHEVGSNSGGNKTSTSHATFVNTILFVLIDVLHHDRILLHADDFCDVCYASLATLQATGLDNEVNGTSNLRSHGFDRHFEPCHHNQRFHTSDGIAWRVGMDRR